ncbi:voltage gated chloride channel family protein, partial [Vibrio parahaemolyticus V-223/04]
MACC